MKSIIPLAIIALLGAGYFFVGPNVVFGGPSKSEIIRVSRDMMRLTAPTPEIASLADSASIKTKGICNKDKENSYFACMVEVGTEGAAPQIFVTELRKDDTGRWVPVQ